MFIYTSKIFKYEERQRGGDTCAHTRTRTHTHTHTQRAAGAGGDGAHTAFDAVQEEKVPPRAIRQGRKKANSFAKTESKATFKGVRTMKQIQRTKKYTQ